MKDQPLVSVLVPVFNAAPFIRDTLCSILTQSYQNIEVIVSDDHSTDETLSILKEYSGDPRVIVLSNAKNLGIAENCNRILEECRGKYIALFAGDDLMLPEKISAQVELMESSPNCSFCYHPVEVFQTESGRVLFDTRRRNGQAIKNAADIVSKLGIPGGMSILLRTECVPVDGFNPTFRYVNDWLFHVELALKGDVGYLDKVLARYRKYGKNNGKALELYEDEFVRCLDFIKNKYPDLRVACVKGEARYYAGLAFRGADRKNMRSAAMRAFRLDRRITYVFLVGLSWFPFFFRVRNLMKELYKRFFS